MNEKLPNVCSAVQVTHDISHLTAADVFRAPGVQTPVIVRFSTVIHERGSPETLRDPRGFAVCAPASRVCSLSRCLCLAVPHSARFLIELFHAAWACRDRQGEPVSG